MSRETHSYTTDIEAREEGGTPAIIESIRTGLAFQLKDAVSEKLIAARDEDLCWYVKRVFISYLDRYVFGYVLQMLFRNAFIYGGPDVMISEKDRPKQPSNSKSDKKL